MLENDTEPWTEYPMRVGLGTYRPLTDELLQLAAQLGVNDILVTPHRHEGFDSVLPLGEAYSYDRLQDVRDRIQDAGLRLFAIEKMPVPLYEILLAEKEDQERLLGIVTDTIRAMGQAGIPVLGYSGHLPDGAVRTSRDISIRGDAKASGFRKEEVDDSRVTDQGYTEADLWREYERFLETVIPIAEEAGVTLGAHPSDPPVETLYGLPLLLRNRENFERALDLVPSDNHGLKLGLGCWSEMGEDIPDVIRNFGDDIVYVHFRDVVGTVPDFHETFIDDPSGNFDAYEVVRTLREVGFDGVMTPDHVPFMAGEDDWEFGGIRGRIFTVGYLKGLLNAVESGTSY